MTQYQKKSIRFSYYEAFITSFVVGLSENYFAAYAVQSGHSTLISGLLISVPLVLAALIQFYVLPYVKSMSVSNFVKNAVLIQSMPLIILAILSILNFKAGFVLLLILYSIYWLGHFSIQPVWNRWIFEIVPAEHGQIYFSVRTRLNQIGIIAGLIIGGLTLHLNVIDVSINNLYFGLFIFSFICKLMTYFLFSRHQSTQIPIGVDREKMYLFFKKFKPFFKSYSLFHFSVYLSAPFVAGYLLNERHLNYFEFMIVMLGLFVGKILMSMWLHRRTSEIDPTKLMFYGGLFAAPLPAFWPLCTTHWQMMMLHVISGIAWASWEVGLALCFFKNVTADQKIEIISLYNYIGITSQVLGTCFGALLVNFIFTSNYNSIFIVAGIVRLICVLPLRRNKLSAEL